MEQEYVMAAIDAALKVDERILSIYEDPGSDFEIERKAGDSPLTIVDRKTHEAIVAILNKTPFLVLSEEGKHMDYAVRRGWDTLRIIDPLNGTKEFVKRNGESTVNMTLVQNAVPVMGVIYVPVKKEPYFAVGGTGTYKCSGVVSLKDEGVTLQQIIEKSERTPLTDTRDHFIAVASRSHLTPEIETYIADLKKKHGSVKLISSGSSIRICLVAEGKADVYPRLAPTMKWDTAAGYAITRAAGMEIYQAGKEEPLRYNKEDLLNPWFIVEARRGH